MTHVCYIHSHLFFGSFVIFCYSHRDNTNMITLWRLVQIKDYKKLHYGVTRLCEGIKKKSIRGMKMDHMIRKEISEKAEKKLRLKDKLSKDYTLIYKSTLDKYVFFCYHASYIIVIGALVGIYHVIVNSSEYDFLKPDVQRELTKPNITIYDQKEVIIANIGLILMNSLLFFLCRRHVLRIWHHAKDNEFVIILPTLLPNSIKNLVFKAGSVVQKYPRARNDITRAPHLINGRVYHLNDYNFRTPADYNRILSL